MTKTANNNERNFLSDIARIGMHDYKALLKKRYLNRNVKLRTLYIEGEMGIGKSQAVYQAAAELSKETGDDVQAVCVSMHCMEAPDWNGLSYIVEGQTFFAQPHLLPTKGHGILFLDEFSRAPKDLHQAALTLIENREINGHQLGDGWIIVTAGNPGQDSTDVLYQVRELDPALKDRLARFKLVPTAAETIAHLSTKYGKDDPVVRWITAEQNVISFDGKGRTSPRSLEYLSRALRVHADMNFFTIASGEVGNAAAIQFQNYLNNPASLTLKDLLEMNENTREIIGKFNGEKREALKQGKMSDLSIMNQWIDLIYTHLSELKAKAEKDGKKFSLADHPKEMNCVAELMWAFDAYEWLTTLVSKVGSLYLLKEDVEGCIFGPILASKKGLRERLKGVYAESKARDEAEKKVLKEQIEDKKAKDAKLAKATPKK